MTGQDSKGRIEEKCPEDLVKRYLDWLNSDIVVRHTYHHHKETTAWVATAGYLTFIVGVIGSVAKMEISLNCCEKVLFFFVMALATRAVGIFIGMQFDKRWDAADEILALKRCRTLLSTFDDAELWGRFMSQRLDLNLEQAAPMLKPIVRPKGDDARPREYPGFIQQELRACKSDRECLWIYLKLLVYPTKAANKEIGARRKSELSSYTLLWVGLLLVSGFILRLGKGQNKEAITSGSRPSVETRTIEKLNNDERRGEFRRRARRKSDGETSRWL